MNPAQGGQGQKAGRTVREIARAARSINVENEVYRFYERPATKEEFSYSLEDGKCYDMENPEDCEAFVERHSDGRKNAKVYIVGTTSNLDKMDREDAIREARKWARSGRIPFIGQWRNKNRQMCVDVSFAINHGMPRSWAIVALQVYRQEAIVEVTRGGYEMIEGEYKGDKPCGGW